MTQVLIKRGNNAQHSTYTGALGELTLNTDTKAVHAHDGTTAGGTAMAKATDLHAYVGTFGGDAIDTNLDFGGDELDWAGGKPQGTFGGDPVTGLVGVAVGLSQRIGNLGALTTTEKTSAVGAINEVKAFAAATDTALYGYVGMAGTTKINTNLTQVGTTSISWVGGLPTGQAGTTQIRGLVGVGLGLAKRIGDIATLTTADKTSTVDAINELKTAVDSKQAALGYTAEDVAQKGQANGYASLDESGKVPTAQLPSYVDDVIEAADFASLPATGESGKIYVTLDTDNTYRWSGSAYIQIGQSVASADTALKLATPRTIALTGAVSGSVDFDGSQNVSITTTLNANTVIDCGTM